MFDYHVHTSFSEDSQADMEETIKKAIQQGIKEVCFTDHVDYDFCVDGANFEFDIKEYKQTITGYAQKYKNKLSILKGVELGVQPHISEKCSKLTQQGEFDFVIASTHTAQRKDIHTKKFFEGKSAKEANEIYYLELYESIKKFNEFSVIGHIDLLKRYNVEIASGKVQNHLDILEEIFKYLIHNGKGIEINTSGYRYDLGEPLPSVKILKMYKQMGGEIVTLGSDSHTKDTLCHNFSLAKKCMEDAGLKYIARFKKMKPYFVKI
ncbi:histidinol-phosphatase HisJ family protein [Proteinivorax hydrogeniformans]|uniref:Histidinol-phosphatase n=1 Tax=Proteinivorax hydrogeniformans TaxID=1826727 RepID=A0AAU8HVS3_9FIRM